MSERHTNAINPMAIVRRGLELSPEFRPVIALLVGSGVLLGLGRVAIPVLFQQLIDDDLLTAAGFDGGRLTTLALITLAVVVAVVVLSVASELLLIRTAEGALARLRQVVLRRAVDLSLEEHSVERQGDLVSRTTGDIEALTRFVDWGAYAWLVNTSIALTATVTPAGGVRVRRGATRQPWGMSSRGLATCWAKTSRASKSQGAATFVRSSWPVGRASAGPAIQSRAPRPSCKANTGCPEGAPVRAA